MNKQRCTTHAHKARASERIPCSRRRLVWSLSLGFVLAYTYALADLLARPLTSSDIPVPSPLVCAVPAAIPLGLLLAALLYAAARAAPALLRRAHTAKPPALRGLNLAFTPRSVARATGVIVLLWLPWIAFAFPCYADWDSVWQLFQFATPAPVSYQPMGIDQVYNAQFIDHKPVFTTLVYGLFWRLGTLLGSQQLGFWLYATLLCLATAAALAAGCCYGEKLGVPAPIRLACLLFVALMPAIPRNAVTLQNDMLFAPCFAVYFLCYVEFFRARVQERALPARGYLVALALACALCVLTKKAGGWLMLLSAVSLICACSGQRVRTALTALAPWAVCAVLVPALVYPACGVVPGGKQEMLSLPLQQVATVYAERPDDLSAQERASIEAVLPVREAAEDLNPTLADPVKKRFIQTATTGEIGAFLATWAALGARHPVIYTEAALNLIYPLLAPVRTYDLPSLSCDFCVPEMAEFEGPANIVLDSPPFCKAMTQVMNRMYDLMASTPLGILFTSGLYGGWLVAAVTSLFIYKAQRHLWVLTPILVSFLIILVSPTAAARYVYPFIAVAPLLVAVILFATSTPREGRKESPTPPKE